MTAILDCSSEVFAVRDWHCDWLVIGSGCGGATAARVLAEAGKQVVVLEEGADLTGAQLTQRDLAMYDQLYTERGGRTTADKSISILSGRVLGGGGVINASDVVPVQEATWQYWVDHFGWKGFGPQDMAPYAARALNDLHANPIRSDQLNRNNLILQRGTEKLGWRGEVMQHNRLGCQGLGTCLIGCPLGAKQNPRMVAIPKALAAGAQVLTRARAVRIEGHDAPIKRVQVRTLDAKGYHERLSFVVHARHVVVAANPVGTVGLLLHSGIGNRWVGHNVSLQPQIPAVALMPEPVHAFDGIPQAFALTEFERHDPKLGLAGFRVEPIFGTPGVLGSLVSQPGELGKQMMTQLPNIAASLVLVPDQPVGRIQLRSDGRPEVLYTLTDEWKQRAREAVTAAARIYLAAGATQVIVPSTPPIILHNTAGLGQIAQLHFASATVPLISAHQQGGARLAPDPDNGACDLTGQLFGTKGVYVCDGSVFPSTSSSHTMAPILTMAHKLAEGMARLG